MLSTSTMNSITSNKLTNFPQPLFPSPTNHPPFFYIPTSSLSFKTPSTLIIKASSSNPQNLKPLKPLQPFSLLTSFVAAIATTALFLSRFNTIVEPAIAQTVEIKNEEILDGEKEREVEKSLNANPNDVDALRSLIEVRIKNNRIDEAMGVVDKLIEIEPNEVEWELLKSHLYIYSGDPETAKIRFNEIIDKDPLRVEAYHGLVMAASQDENVTELKGIEGRIEEGMRVAKKESRKSDLRDFKLLIAQVWVIVGKYDEALEVYEELVKDEPRDFRPYLCQGIIYTLLRKNSEAEKSFEKYRRLVPEGHPYARYFDDNMIATKLYAQKLDSERDGLKV